MSDTSFPILSATDADATYERSRAAGAASVEAPADQPWGERVASVRDPAGFVVHLGMPTALAAT